LSDIAVHAEALGKAYRLTPSAGRFQTLQEQYHYRSFREELTLLAGRVLRRTSARTQETKWALRDVGFEVRPGEVVGIIGRNGAGKSTLLKLLARISEPTTGFIDLWGRVGALLEVGTGFHPELTGRENIFLSGAILGMSRVEIRRKFDDMVAFAEIAEYLEMPVKRYSCGMYMRLAFAVAAHLEPEILLVDEVLAVGDAAFQRKCLAKMQEVGARGRTVLFVSHDMAAIARLCPRTILLQDGQILRDGPSPEVTRTYLEFGASSVAERTWPDLATAPGEESVRLLAVRVRDDQGRLTDAIDIRRPVQLEVEYHNFASERSPYVSLQLFDEAGVCLFTAGDFTNRQWRQTPRQFEGRVVSRCLIPGNLLAEGLKRVAVALTTHNPDRELACERDAVTFMVVDHSEGDGARGDFGGNFPGVMRPLLNWQIAFPNASGTTELV